MSEVFSSSFDQLDSLPEGIYWVTDVRIFLEGVQISSGIHRFWEGVYEENGLTKDLLKSRLKEKVSVFTGKAVCQVRGFIHTGG